MKSIMHFFRNNSQCQLRPTETQQWLSNMLLFLGVGLLLSGVIFFYAFNWYKMSSIMKLGSIQLGIITCLICSWLYSLDHIIGKVWLLSASVMVGVFLAVFGQIYQTGSDIYQLFGLWSILIFLWTLMSNFSAQWALWLVLVHASVWCFTGFDISTSMQLIAHLSLMVLNGILLGLYEYCVCKNSMQWLKVFWIRYTLIWALLIQCGCHLSNMIGQLISLKTWYIEPLTLIIGLSSLVVYLVLFCVYRFGMYRRKVVSAILFCVSIIVYLGYCDTFNILGDLNHGIATIFLFSLATQWIRRLPKDNTEVEIKQVSQDSHVDSYSDEISDVVLEKSQPESKKSSLSESALSLIMIGALLFCFMGFFHMDGLGFIIYGLMMIVGVCMNNRHDGQNILWSNIALVLMLLGKGFLVYGLIDQCKIMLPVLSSSVYCGIYGMSLLVVSVITYQYYKNTTDTFISTLVISGLWALGSFDSDSMIAFQVFLITQWLVAVIILVKNRNITPVSLALLSSVFVMVCLDNFIVTIPFPLTIEAIIIKLVLSMVMLLSLWRLMRGNNHLNIQSVLFWLVMVLFCVVSSPGMIMALTLVVIGFEQQQKYITLGGFIALVIFISDFYYQLDMLFIHKSMILMGSGLLLFFARGLLNRNVLMHRRAV